MVGATEMIFVLIRWVKILFFFLLFLLSWILKEEEIPISEEWDVIIEEILPRLPTKDLQKFKSVCKNWSRLISSPYFVRLHLSRYNERRIRLITRMNCGVEVLMMEYNSFNGDEETKAVRPAITRIVSTITIVGSCDGLLACSVSGGRSIMVYNPSTGEYSISQLLKKKKHFMLNCSWFGHHPSSGEYILLWGITNPRKFTSKVGVFRFNRSSELEPIRFVDASSFSNSYNEKFSTCYNEKGTFLHGVVHWPSCWDLHYVIGAYNLHDNNYSEISIPLQSYFKLGVNAEECLFAIFKTNNPASVFEMWVMKEYGVEKSWMKYASIEGFDSNTSWLSPLGFFSNGDIILDVDKVMVIKYSFNHKSSLILMKHDIGRSHEAVLCAHSLVSPKI